MLNVKCEMVTRKSKKTGNDYTALELTFANGYKKLILLDTAERFMLESLNGR